MTVAGEHGPRWLEQPAGPLPFLEGCGAGAKLLAFGLLAPGVMAWAVLTPAWGAALLLVVAALGWGIAVRGPWWRPWWRLRWLAGVLLLVHLLLTPGEPVWAWLPWLTREGLYQGGRQTARLLLLAGLAWVLVRSTTPRQLMAALGRAGAPLGPAVARGLALTAFALAQVPNLMQEAEAVREQMQLRLGGQLPKGRWGRWAVAGEALLQRTLATVDRQEEAMRQRGYERELPPLPRSGQPWGGREWAVLLLAGIPWLLPGG